MVIDSDKICACGFLLSEHTKEKGCVELFLAKKDKEPKNKLDPEAKVEFRG